VSPLPPSNLTRLKDQNPIDAFVREMEAASQQMQVMLNEVRVNSNGEISAMNRDLEYITETLKDLHKTIRGEGSAPGLIERVATMEERLNHTRASIVNQGEADGKASAANVQGGWQMKVAMLGSFTSLISTLIMIIIQIVLKK
jgi:hypothetical protein